MGAADPELSAGKNVHEGHMKKRHFAPFRGQLFTDFARFCYDLDGATEAWIYQLRWRETVKNWVSYDLFCVLRYWKARKWQFGTCLRTFEKDCRCSLHHIIKYFLIPIYCVLRLQPSRFTCESITKSGTSSVWTWTWIPQGQHRRRQPSRHDPRRQRYVELLLLSSKSVCLDMKMSRKRETRGGFGWMDWSLRGWMAV